MKKLILLSAIGAAMFASSCSDTETITDLNEYTDCFSYSVDTVTGIGSAADFASIKITGDISTSTYNLDLKDFRLYDGAPLRTANITNLNQYFVDERDENDKVTNILYTIFHTEQSARYSGDLDLKSFRMGWLSTIFWLNFTSGPYKVWSLPRRYDLYAIKNTVISPYPGPNVEKSINPKYTFSLNGNDSKVSVKASGVTLPVDNTDPTKTVRFRVMEWPDLPVIFNEKGYTIDVASFNPVTDGKNDEWRIRNFKARISSDYEGLKSATYILEKTDGSLRLNITTEFSYTYPQNI